MTTIHIGHETGLGDRRRITGALVNTNKTLTYRIFSTEI